jgi:PucR C-terminal helix-turn-helix domain/GGDEF-like domain
MFERIGSVTAVTALDDPEYVASLRQAIGESLEYAIAGIELGERPAETIPVVAGEQARRSARSGVSLDAVLRGYYAGDRLLSEVILGEAGNLPCSALREIMRTQGTLVDHFVAMIVAEYKREVERIRKLPDGRLAERIRRLLKGDADEDPELLYGLGGWHIGVIASGEGAETLLRNLAKRFNCEVLCVPGGGDVTWVWIGKRSRLPVSEVERTLAREASQGASFAIGEARHGIEGWRLTHREAQAARGVMAIRPRSVLRSRDAILTAAVLQDPALAESLIETYLKPLDERGRVGVVLRETLRAYFKANQNAAAAALALGVDRHTVERRLRSVEEKLDQPLPSCRPQLQVALDAEQLLAMARGGMSDDAGESEPRGSLTALAGGLGPPGV